MLLSAGLFAPAAWAYDFDVDGIYYTITSSTSSRNKTVEVAYGGGAYSGDVIIPATVTYEDVEYRVTAIGDDAFSWCTGLTSVTIPESVTAIGDEAFSRCSGLENFEGKIATADHRCLVINDTLKAFAPSGLTRYTIPDGVKVIGERAFFKCSGLMSVTIPESVTAIGWRAFEDCSGLTSVTIGKSVQTIGSGVFYACKNLTSVTIPESVQTIGVEAFSQCSGLGNFEGKFATADHRCLVINDTLIAFAPSGLTQYTIPDEVKVIGNYAFSWCTGLTSVTIPKSVQTIGDWAFAYCDGLTSVTIGDGVTTIGDYAFYGCTGLASVTIGKNVQTIGDYAFSWCTGLTSVTIPESVQVIGVEVFSGCRGLKNFEGKIATADHRCLVINDTLRAFASSGLTQYTIPDDVKVIGDNTFWGCDGLTSVTIPESVIAIGDDAFSYCDGLTSVTIGCSTIGDDAFSNCTGLTSVTIGDGVTTIGDYAFSCTGLTSVTIPESVTAIGDEAFSRCSGLENFEGKIATADHRCLVINDTLRAFAQSGLTQYTIPNEVKVIGDGVFYCCYSLTEITIPNSVTAIGDCAFASCGLTSVTIPESVISIGRIAFRYCSGLKSVTIGKGVTTIGPSAFFRCTGLTSVTAYNSTPVDIVITNESGYPYVAFDNVDCANCKLYVPKGSVEAYRNAEGWSEFGEILPIDESSAITETRQDNADGHVTVYNLQGVPVLETDDAADLKMLQNGAYIVNGKKMIIAR